MTQWTQAASRSISRIISRNNHRAPNRHQVPASRFNISSLAFFSALSLGLGSLGLGLPISAQAADITGTVKYEGQVPNLKPLKMDADPVCVSKHSEPPVSEALVLGDGNTMANVFVQVTKGLPEGKTYPAPSEPVVVTQEGCMYNPHVFGLMAGQSVKFLNPDGTLHNVHALPKENRQFNLAMPANRTEAEKDFPKPEPLFPIKCDVHPWMNAFAAVMSHPFFAVTDKSGTFKISGLEPGTYEVQAWHEKLGTQTATVEVKPEGGTADFTFSRGK